MEREVMATEINIDLGDKKTPEDIATALVIIARQLTNGCYSGIAGWSDVSWNIRVEEQ